MRAKRIAAYIIIAFGGILIALSFFLKCYMFGFSNFDRSEHVTIYAYTFNEEKTKAAVDSYFSDSIFVLAEEKAMNLKPGDIEAVHTKVYKISYEKTHYALHMG